MAHNKMYTNQNFFIDPTEDLISDAVKNAAVAFEELKSISLHQKILFFGQLSIEIEAIRPTLVDIASRETKLGSARLNGELDRTINQINIFTQQIAEGSWVNAIIDTPKPERLPVPKPDLRQMQKPIGVVTVYGASNFPFAFSVAGGDTISALAAGCPVLYKVHPGHPETSKVMSNAIFRAMEKTGMPENLFAAFAITDRKKATYLVTHPLVKAVGFTGSLTAGRALFNAAGSREEPIPVYAEMGSVNPVFLLPGKLTHNPAELARTLAASNTLGAGQFCTNPGIIIMTRSDAATLFEQAFKQAIEATKGSEMLTKGIYNSYVSGVAKLSGLPGAEISATGPAETDTAQPTVIRVTGSKFLAEKAFAEECFGPCSVHVMADNEKQLLEIAEQICGQLTVSIWCDNNDCVQFKSLFDTLENKAGRIIINNAPTGVEVAHAMVHGGPYPATTDARCTSVGATAIYRFTRPVCFQNFPDQLLPDGLKNSNPLNIWRKIDGELTKNQIH